MLEIIENKNLKTKQKKMFFYLTGLPREKYMDISPFPGHIQNYQIHQKHRKHRKKNSVEMSSLNLDREWSIQISNSFTSSHNNDFRSSIILLLFSVVLLVTFFVEIVFIII